MTNLEKALSMLLDETASLTSMALVLARAVERGSVSYEEIAAMAGDGADDVLLSADAMRLLLPMRLGKSGAWEDRLLLCEPGESYTMPNVVQRLVLDGGKTGRWNPGTAIAETFREMGEAEWEAMPGLVEQLKKSSEHNHVDGSEVRSACVRVGLGDKADLFIAELKAAGVMSPRLAPLAEVTRAGSPLYELNPSLFLKGTGKAVGEGGSSRPAEEL